MHRTLFVLLLVACETSPSPTDAGSMTDGGMIDAGPIEELACDGLVVEPPMPACDPLATDYEIPSDAEFLNAYYAALRARLERKLLFGRRRLDKHDR